jgi:hypothetical protein
MTDPFEEVRRQATIHRAIRQRQRTADRLLREVRDLLTWWTPKNSVAIQRREKLMAEIDAFLKDSPQ